MAAQVKTVPFLVLARAVLDVLDGPVSSERAALNLRLVCEVRRVGAATSQARGPS